VARKRAHNALQDAKGKIRVYCRVRPMLEFEAAKNQVRHIQLGVWFSRSLSRPVCGSATCGVAGSNGECVLPRAAHAGV
jgi:hypothetical protein